MPDHPASDPAKPGSKLASMQALGRRGNIRPSEEETPITAKDGSKKPGRVEKREAKPSPAVVKQAQRKRATKPKVKTVKRAKAVLKRAEASQPKAKKPGPPVQIGQPWKEAGVSKSTYYRNQRRMRASE